MKYKILLLVAVVFGSYCWGQAVVKIDTIDFGSALSTARIWATPINTTPKQDTVKVLMLVCDTFPLGKYMKIGDTPLGSWTTNDNKNYYLFQTYWQFGYEVWEIEWGSVPCSGYGAILCYGWYRNKFIGHLDQNKKPLPKSIVVWITKEIKLNIK